MPERLAAVQARVLPFVGEERADAIERDFEGSDGVRHARADRRAARGARRSTASGYAIHYFPESAYDRSSLELFEREVIPALA